MLRADLVSAEDRTLLQTAARAVLLSRGGTLAEQIGRRQRSPAARATAAAAARAAATGRRPAPAARPSSSSTASVASLRMGVST